jgi:hypothetical protein
VKDKKFEGFLVSHENGDTQYLTAREYKLYLENTGENISVRFSDAMHYDKMKLDLEKIEIGNESEKEYFGYYDGTAIAIKKFQ